MSTWLDILREECARRTIKDVARDLGYARTSISLVVNGRYPGPTRRVEAKVIEVFGGAVTCPHLKAAISPAQCRAHASAPMPTHDAGKLRHWTACRSCPLNPVTSPEKEESGHVRH